MSKVRATPFVFSRQLCNANHSLPVKSDRVAPRLRAEIAILPQFRIIKLKLNRSCQKLLTLLYTVLIQLNILELLLLVNYLLIQ